MKTKTLLLNTALVFSAQAIPMTAQADVLAIGPNAKVLQHAAAPKPGTSMRMVAGKFGPAKNVKKSKGKSIKRILSGLPYRNAMNKMNYLTGYLPYVYNRDYKKKQIKRRIVLATGFTLSILLLLLFWETNTSAQDKSSDFYKNISYNSPQLQPTSDKPIWSSLAKPEKPILLAKGPAVKSVNSKEKLTMNSQIKQLPVAKKITETGQTSDQVKDKRSTDEIREAYNKDLEILLDKAFSN
ncbi:hypothetical protein GQR58_019242 [Nymphon striatum]|nr:hypothetical protein GQR58_019242 [Nymphon striatum]